MKRKLSVFLIYSDRWTEWDEDDSSYVVSVTNRAPSPDEIGLLFGKTFKAMYLGLNKENQPAYTVKRPGTEEFLVTVEECRVTQLPEEN